MHIAYLHYLYGRDTAFHHVRQFVAAARELGHRVDVHAMNLAPPDAGPGGAEPLTRRLRSALKRRFSRYLHDPKELVWNARYVRRETALLERDRPDVLLVRNYLLGVSCAVVARRLDLPLVLEVNAPAEEARCYYDEYLHLAALQEWTERFKLRRADAVTVVSAALCDYLVERYAVAQDKLTVVPNGADLALFHPALTPDPELAPAAGEVTVGFVGSFQKFHGVDVLVEMVRRVSAARPGVRFLLVGDGPGLAGAREALAGVAGVTFTGRVAHERVPGLVACLDVGVMPESNFYGSPLKVVEWMAAARAVVAPAYGPLAEILDDGVEGRLFPPGDVDALTAAVLELVDDPPKRRRFGTAAASRVRSSLTWHDNARRVLSACEAARERHRARARTARSLADSRLVS